jgi:hypothetical protein
MSESVELNILYSVLQIVGIITFFICCLACLYKKGMRDKQTKIHDENIHNKNLKSRIELLEKKIKILESNKLATIV